MKKEIKIELSEVELKLILQTINSKKNQIIETLGISKDPFFMEILGNLDSANEKILKSLNQ